MDKTYSMLDVIEITADMLTKVRLPVNEIDAIDVILAAVKNLTECAEALKSAQKTEAEPEKEVNEDV